MKRHDSLAPLSREHHESLLLAQILKKNAPPYRGMPTGGAQKVALAASLFHEKIREHFSREDSLLDTLSATHPELNQFRQEIQSEHRLLSEAFESLHAESPDPAAMDALGQALEKHIRKEERIVFPLIEQLCSEAELNQIRDLHA